MKKRISIILIMAVVISLCVMPPVNADQDVAQTISLPAALLQGHTYSLQFPEMNLSVNGAACSGSFVAEGEEATLAYTDKNGNAIASYTLPVVDTKNADDQCAYFYDPAGAVSLKENENEVALTFSKDSQISFLNKLNAEDISLYMAFVEGATNFDTITVKLTDSFDATVSLTFRVELSENKITLGSQKAELKDLKDILQLRYNNVNRVLSLNNGPELMTCEKSDSGADFLGFTGGVYMCVGFENVSGRSSLNLTRINNQALGHKNSTVPDLAEPSMKLTSELPYTRYIGDTFAVPTFEAYDVFSPIVESSVKVEAPDGTAHTSDFAVSQYGKYKVTFLAKDAHGNTMKNVKMVFVNDDKAPTLQVNALSTTGYKLGDAVTVPGYTATDNLGVCNVDVILFLPNGEIRLLTSDKSGTVKYCLTDSSLYSSTFIQDQSSFKTEQVGTYTIRYVAYDDQYNRAVQELTFTVEQGGS